MSTALADPITEETLSEITRVTKAATSGINVSTGFTGVDMSGVVSLVSANTPFYDRVTRVTAPQGAAAATWRASLNVNSSQPDPFVGDDNGGGDVVFSEHDMLAPFRPVRVTGRVTQDAIDKSRGYDDAKARATAGTLIQWRIAANKGYLGANAVALPTIGTVTVTSAATGGTITSGTTLYVKAAARSGSNYYWGGSGIASNAANVTVGTTTSTNSAAATVPAVRGAVAYDWFTSTNGSTYYYTTTTAYNAATFTATLSAHAAIPSALTLPGLYSTAPTTPPVADTSYSSKRYNGLITSLTQDYSSTGALATYGTGDLVSGCSVISLDGATLTGAAQGITELDALNAAIFAIAQTGPTAYLVAPQQSTDIGTKVMGTNQASTFLARGDDRTKLTGGAAVTQYVNRTTNEVIPIITDPWMFPGTIVALTETVPYPESGFSNTFEARVLREVSETPYGASTSAGGAGEGPRQIWDCSSMESFIVRAPVACGILT
ncbi:MAG: hypothetical protein EPO09_21315, partial [Aquabacterium sp.]|uniref:hypothetical protein n=1 Tax=Aquabacterium sp. TaxID=1872578 RepID=UPI001213961B